MGRQRTQPGNEVSPMNATPLFSSSSSRIALPAFLLALCAAACGGTSAEGGAGGGGPLAAPPLAVASAPPCDGPGAVFAVSKLYLGDTDRDGTPDPVDGWKQYGFNLDGQATGEAWENVGLSYDPAAHCLPRPGTNMAAAFERGNGGINNSFGHNVFANLLYGALGPGISTAEDQAIDAGTFTNLFDIEKLGPQPSYAGLLALSYAGANLGHAPRWDGSDRWPVLPEQLANPKDVTTAETRFPASYLSQGTWVSGSKGDVVVSLVIDLSSSGGSTVPPFVMTLDILNAEIAMDLGPDGTSATNGTLAGVLDTDALVAQFQEFAAAVGGPGLCSGPTVQSILDAIGQASDIMKDGTQDPTQVCDGISIGLGFDAKAVQLGGIAPAQAPAPTVCQ
jgi:hypothetical protein